MVVQGEEDLGVILEHTSGRVLWDEVILDEE